MQKKVKRVNWVLCFLILLCPPNGSSADSLGQNFLQDITSDLSEGRLTVRFEFNEPVLNPTQPVFDNKSVRVDIFKAFVQPAKRFYYTGDSRIPQIFVSQLEPNILRLQFVLGEKLPHLAENFQVEDQGRSLVFHIFKREEDVLSEFLARAADRIDLLEDHEEVIRHLPDESATQSFPGLLEENNKGFILDKIAAESPSPEESPNRKIPATPSLHFEENKEHGPGGALDLASITLKTFFMFALVLALMFFVFYLFKKFVLKNTIFGGGEKIIRVLGTGFLGPKKNIVLVEVAGEILVLGTSNDNISLLTHIQDKEKIEKIKASEKGVNGKKFWKPQKENDSAPESLNEPTRADGSFANYLKQFSGALSEKEKSVEEVTGLIRKNLGKLKTL